jgi:hypothetical protein
MIERFAAADNQPRLSAEQASLPGDPPPLTTARRAGSARSSRDLAAELHTTALRLLLLGYLADAASIGVAVATAPGWRP